MNSWRKFHQLSQLEQWLLLWALLLLPLTALGLQLIGFRRLYTALTNLAPKCSTLIQDQVKTLTQANATARMVRAAAWHGAYHANCLQQSVVLWWLLRCQGIASDLRIGVRKEASQFEAHAWVEYLDFALNDSSDTHQRYFAFEGAIAPIGVKSQ